MAVTGKRRRRKNTCLGRSRRRVGEWDKYAAKRCMEKDNEGRTGQEIIVKKDTRLSESNSLHCNEGQNLRKYLNKLGFV